jgi:hypothetical protein
MADISFRLRKYANGLGQSFFLWNGKDLANLDSYLVGDTVSVMFEVSEEQVEAVNALEQEDFRICLHMGGQTMAHIPCKVVARNHGIVWESVGKFQRLTSGIVLEAASGFWEDLLQWITSGIEPSWSENRHRVS